MKPSSVQTDNPQGGGVGGDLPTPLLLPRLSSPKAFLLPHFCKRASGAFLEAKIQSLLRCLLIAVLGVISLQTLRSVSPFGKLSSVAGQTEPLCTAERGEREGGGERGAGAVPGTEE